MPDARHQIPVSEFETLRYRTDNHVAHITLDRPEKRNALNIRAYRELGSAFAAIAADEGVRAVVLTGADPGFCSGDDVGAIMAGEELGEILSGLNAPRPRPTPEAVAVLECDRPVIAAVNGPAVGWGMELALFADIRIASDRARFAELFVQRGLVCDVGGFMRLPALVGPEKAAELLFTGDVVDAEEALRIGLVSRVVPHGELIPQATALAERIAQNPPLAVRHIKEGLRRAALAPDVEAMGSWVSAALGKLFETEDHKEGARAFLEKRAPVFKGR